MSQPEPESVILPPAKRGCRAAVIGLLLLGVIAVLGMVATALIVRTRTLNRYEAAVALAERQDPGAWRLADIEIHRSNPAVEANPSELVREAYKLMPANMFGTFFPRRTVSPIGQLLEILDELPGNLRPDDSSLTVLTEGLSGTAKSLAVAQPLADTGEGRFPLTVRFNPLETVIADIKHAEDVAHLIQLESARRAFAGDAGGALESARVVLGIARAIGDDPILIGQIIRMNITGIALRSAERGLGQGEATDAILALLQDQLAQEAQQPLLLYGIRGERAMMHDLLEKMEAGQIDGREFSGDSVHPQSASHGVYVNPILRIYYLHNHAIYLERLNQARDNLTRPPIDQLPTWERLAGEVTLSNEREGWFGQLAATLTPSMSAIGNALARRLAEIHSLIALVAAERYRIVHEAWPSSPEDLEPFLPGGLVPIDPCSGRPIRLAQTDDGFVCYSIGLDRVDDGGLNYTAEQAPLANSDLGFRLWNLDQRRQPAEIMLRDIVAP